MLMGQKSYDINANGPIGESNAKGDRQVARLMSIVTATLGNTRHWLILASSVNLTSGAIQKTYISKPRDLKLE